MNHPCNLSTISLSPSYILSHFDSPISRFRLFQLIHVLHVNRNKTKYFALLLALSHIFSFSFVFVTSSLRFLQSVMILFDERVFNVMKSLHSASSHSPHSDQIGSESSDVTVCSAHCHLPLKTGHGFFSSTSFLIYKMFLGHFKTDLQVSLSVF